MADAAPRLEGVEEVALGVALVGDHLPRVSERERERVGVREIWFVQRERWFVQRGIGFVQREIGFVQREIGFAALVGDHVSRARALSSPRTCALVTAHVRSRHLTLAFA